MRALIMTLIWCGAVVALAGQQPPARQTPPLALESLGGTDSYLFYCAPCHGRTGLGDGPAASALRNAPADLTTLTERAGGVFPRDRVIGFVSGIGRPIAAHGTGDMPIWGPAFRALDASDRRAAVRIAAIVDHIESLQAENGATLYRQSCATCHGPTGQGNGPLASALRRVPPDLTKYAMRNGGVFPSERVEQIIDGRDVPSHGDRDMPVWGDTFRRTSRDGSAESARARIQALVRFLRAIQERPAE